MDAIRRLGRAVTAAVMSLAATTFHWTGEGQLPDGSWQLEAEFFGHRRP